MIQKSLFFVTTLLIFFKFLEKIIHTLFSVFLIKDSQFIIYPIPFYKHKSIEGIKPVLIIKKENLGEIISLKKINNFLTKIPFLGPLSIFTFIEAQEYERLTRSNKLIFKAKQIQKLINLKSKLIDNFVKDEKLYYSITQIFKEFSDDFIEITSVIQVNEFLKKFIEITAESHLELIKFPDEIILDIKEFYSHFFKTNFTSEKSGKGILLNQKSLYFWAMITPGTVAKNIIRPNELESYWRDNVIANYLLLLSESRPSKSIASWIEREMGEVRPTDTLLVPSLNTRDQVRDFAPEPFCNRPFTRLTTTCEGTAFFCCWQSQSYESPGNIADTSVLEVWNSNVAQETRSDILDGKLPKICKSVAGCPYLLTENKPSYANYTSPQPVMLEILLPNFSCNIGGIKPTKGNPACIMCERDQPGYRFEDDKNFDLVLEKLREFIPNILLLHIQGVAEPFWKNAIFEILDKVNFDPYANKIRVTTTTNGTVFTPERQKKLLERCPKLGVSLSMDATSSSTYKAIRRLDAYDTVLANAKNFGLLIKSYPDVSFRIQNNINLINIHEIVEMVSVAKDIGVEELELFPTFSVPEDRVVNQKNAHLFKKAEEEARTEAKRLGVQLLVIRPLDLGLS